MVVTDPDDNCIPAWLAEAQAAGLCAAGSTGPECEEAVSFGGPEGSSDRALVHVVQVADSTPVGPESLSCEETQ